jgi:hypothetical protein
MAEGTAESGVKGPAPNFTKIQSAFLFIGVQADGLLRTEGAAGVGPVAFIVPLYRRALPRLASLAARD